MDKKRVYIPHNGPIYPKGGVYGPISTPYMESLDTIVALLVKQIPVVEVLNDGSEVKLNLSNYNKPHSVFERVWADGEPEGKPATPPTVIDDEEKRKQAEAEKAAEKDRKDKEEADRLAKQKEEEELAELIRLEEEETRRKQQETDKKQQTRQPNTDKKNNNNVDVVGK